MKIAVLDDDKTHLQLVEQALLGGDNGWVSLPRCRFFDSGVELLNAVKNEAFDVVILDRKVPDMSGDVILQWLRQYSMPKFGIYTVVIMLTHLREEKEELYSLQSGADDYLTKPFSPAKLVARIKRLLEISSVGGTARSLNGVASKFKIIDDKQSPVVALAGYTFHSFDGLVEMEGGQVVRLTALEFRLALFLLSNVGVTMSRQEIFEHVWAMPMGNQRTLDTHMHRLRLKLLLTVERGFNLRTVYGYGYRLDRDHQQESVDQNH